MITLSPCTRHSRKARNLGAGLIVLAILGGCANAEKRACESGNWESLGYNDGVAGRGFERIGALNERCSDYEISVDSAAWTEGHARGIAEYCEPANGYDLGEADTDYTGSCPRELEKPFLSSYIRGLGLHRDELKLGFDRLQSDLEDARRERQSLDDDDSPKKLDKRIDSLRDELDENLSARRGVNKRIGRWSRNL